jgi:glycosyltransferase involved in cell wall biosynthesis
VDLSVIIPTLGRPFQLSACISRLARQSINHKSFEVLVGIDGSENGELSALGAVPENLQINTFARGGLAFTRNRLADLARGRILLFLSDHAVPSGNLLEHHLANHTTNKHGPHHMLMGHIEYRPQSPERLFDRLIRDRSVMFSAEPIAGAGLDQPDYDWGFRHAWSANLSIPADVFRKVGGFTKQLSRNELEDTELAWRLSRWLNIPLHFQNRAGILIDCRFDPMDMIRREAILGFEAYQLAILSPQCARDLYGRDITSQAELQYTRGYLKREKAPAEQALWSVINVSPTLCSTLTPMEIGSKVTKLDETATALRRYLWRLGLLHAIENTPVSHLNEHVQQFIDEAASRRGEAGPTYFAA